MKTSKEYLNPAVTTTGSKSPTGLPVIRTVPTGKSIYDIQFNYIYIYLLLILDRSLSTVSLL